MVDYITYRSLLWLTGYIAISKAIGIITGTTFSFFSNRTFTFKRDSTEMRQVVSYLIIYATTMSVNVLINNTVIHFLGHNEIGINVGFLVAAAVQAALNFVGLKKVVFKPVGQATASADPAAKNIRL